MLIDIITIANSNKIFLGCSMLFMNFGSKYLIGDLGKSHEKLLSNQIVKKLIVFSLFFVATRDVITAFLLTILYIFIIDGILHEKSKFCIVPKKLIEGNGDTTNQSTLIYKNNLASISN